MPFNLNHFVFRVAAFLLIVMHAYYFLFKLVLSVISVIKNNKRYYKGITC